MKKNVTSEEPNSIPKDKRAGAKFIDLAENIVKLSAILGVFGYMSLRAHLNYVGISYTSSLGIERYLMETYNLVVTTFFPLVSVLLRLVLGLFLLYLLRVPLARAWNGFRLILNKVFKTNLDSESIREALRRSCSKPLTSGLLLLFPLVVYVGLQELLDRYSNSDAIAVGPLKSSNLERIDAVLPYYLLCLICMFGFFVYSIVSRIQKTQPQLKPHRLGRLFLTMFAVTLLALALHIPIIYGRFLHSSNYNLIGLNHKVGDRSISTCGLLVLDSDSSVLIWRAEKRAGRIIEIPRSQIQVMSTGPNLDLMSLARQAADNDAMIPICDFLDNPANPLTP